MSTDPWCKKCPFHIDCIDAHVNPQDLSCDVNRIYGGQLPLSWIETHHHPFKVHRFGGTAHGAF